jgi:hypothetical protein
MSSFKKLTSKGTLRQVFICLRSKTPSLLIFFYESQKLFIDVITLCIHGSSIGLLHRRIEKLGRAVSRKFFTDTHVPVHRERLVIYVLFIIE